MRTPAAASLVLLLVLATSAQADFIYTTYQSPTPENSWAYSIAVGVGRGNSTNYVPTLADAAGKAVFEGYVSYPGGLGWIHYQPSLYDEDTTRIFTTYVMADHDMSIPVVVGGDDGSSIYINGIFSGGGGFGASTDTTLNLKAGVATRIDLLGYNGPGPWELVFYRQDGTEFADTPGITLNADGNFASPVPEPSTLALAASGLLSAITFGLHRKRRPAPPAGPASA
jgi:hypothetical protein